MCCIKIETSNVANAVEKAFWVIVVIFGLGCSLSLVTTQMNDWHNDPVGKEFGSHWLQLEICT